MTEAGKPMSNDVIGLSTEGKDSKLPTDKGPETTDSILNE